MAQNTILTAKPGSKLLLLGNEAIVRGALEAGVEFVTTYPGTPASEIGDTFAKLKKPDVYFEYSVNEKVALELAVGASLSKARSLVAMKHVGLNVCSDTLITLAYSGVKGSLVVISADDPSCYSSQNEQDSRYYAMLANIPLLEPSTVQEAKELTKYAFELSEKLELPVLLRTTTRVSHVRGVVKLGKIEVMKKEKKFEKDPMRLVSIPLVSKPNHKRLLDKIEKAQKLAESSKLNFILKNNSSIGIVTSGVAYNYVLEALEKLNFKASILKLGFTHPFAKNLAAKFASTVDKIIVVEELEPYLELNMRAFTKTQIFGKVTNHLPRAYEYSTDIVMESLAKILKLTLKPLPKVSVKIPSRPATLCPGCPHRATFYATKIATQDKGIYPTDIGCYALGIREPLEIADLLLCMGAGVGSAGGFAKYNQDPVIAFLGDSTFYHAGIPALINAVHNKHRFVLVILDNLTTAMTGHQPHPGKTIALEDLAKGCGVKFVKVVDPYNTEATIAALKEAIAQEECSVVIARRICSILAKPTEKKYFINDKCKKCFVCLTKFGCPAFYLVNKKEVKINPALCVGCGVCTHICKFGAIEERK
jgi:indolepyruvate ferredoxin oxidoreductase alpha subunit